MVATKIHEVAGKGLGWASKSSDQTPASTPLRSKQQQQTHHSDTTAQPSSSSSSIWESASKNISSAAESISSYTSPFFQYVGIGGGGEGGDDGDDRRYQANDASSSALPRNELFGDNPRANPMNNKEKTTTFASPLGSLFQNPIVSIRGGRQYDAQPPKNSSIEAVRSLLSVVPQGRHQSSRSGSGSYETFEQEESHSSSKISRSAHPSSDDEDDPFMNNDHPDEDTSESATRRMSSPPLPRRLSLQNTLHYKSQRLTAERLGYDQQFDTTSPEETASQLAEGTVRALRDLLLDEAVSLHEALRFWSYRWEKPLLGWWEAGPLEWRSYQHARIGQKVSTLQAVLARRCAAIGELQQHLLRSGWQQGVAQWGVLGAGGEWATIAGFDGNQQQSSQSIMMSGSSGLDDQEDEDDEQDDDSQADEEVEQEGDDTYEPAGMRTMPPQPLHSPIPPRRTTSFTRLQSTGDLTPPPAMPPRPGELSDNPALQSFTPHQPKSRVSQLPQNSQKLYYTNVFVANRPNGDIVVDNKALAAWSVDAIRLVRRHLSRSSLGTIELPYNDNWAIPLVEENASTLVPSNRTLRDSIEVEGNASYFIPEDTDADAENDDTPQPAEPPKPRRKSSRTPPSESTLPVWAGSLPRSLSSTLKFSKDNISEQQHIRSSKKSSTVVISDLPLMVDEVSELLFVMEDVVAYQRSRRLEKLQPPKWMNRRWYLFVFGAPSLLILSTHLRSSGYGLGFLKSIAGSILSFFKEHVTEPFQAIVADLLKGTENISDREARDVTIANLKIMIREWLADHYPQMDVRDREKMADLMDISLIEAKKAEALTSFLEINNVIRMSFIEAQFIKKEMMNALLALDEMQASNNINMNLAAVTPALLLMYCAKRAFQLVVYGMLKFGKSREETYGNFLHVLTEIERLLVMRDKSPASPTMLSGDDLGMLMLHIHELRTILWNYRRRFQNDLIRSVAEDLSELAGERGAVSVQQQLQIISRMCRMYPFLHAGRQFAHSLY